MGLYPAWSDSSTQLCIASTELSLASLGPIQTMLNGAAKGNGLKRVMEDATQNCPSTSSSTANAESSALH